MTDDELEYILGAIEQILNNAGRWGAEYDFNPSTGEYAHRKWKEKAVDWLNWQVQQPGQRDTGG
jgi:hypothetical protein